MIAPLVSSLVAAALVSVDDRPARDGFLREAQPFLAAHCVRCHGAPAVQGGLDLSLASSERDVLAASDDWLWLRERVAAREMPPKGEALPDDASREAFVAWLDGVLAGAERAPASAAEPSAPRLRRLTNRAYANAARDLFGVRFDAGAHFPADAVGHGYEGVGEAQVLSDELVELYVRAAEIVAERAIVVDPPGAPPVLEAPHADLTGPGRSGADGWHLHVNGTVGVELPLRRPGRYLVRAEVSGQQAGPDPVRVALVLGGAESAAFDVTATSPATQSIEAELAAADAPAFAGVRFLNDYWDPSHPDPASRDRNLVVREVEVRGPLDPAEPSAFLAEALARAGAERGPDALEGALRHLVRRVWRRPATEGEIERLAGLTRADDPIEARLQTALVAALAAPDFLFLVEAGEGEPSRRAHGAPADSELAATEGADAGVAATEAVDAETAVGARRLDDFELAARLAFFLWSSVPDPALDALADAGRLQDPTVFAAEVDRMLADPRAESLADGFATQWLHLGPLDERTVDESLFPGFDADLRRSMAEETRRVFLHHLRTDAPLAELLIGTRTFVDARLAAHYGVPFDPSRGRWQEVDLAPTGRRGLLGHASVLTVTSEPTRTSPVKRGKWVLEVLLGDPPPPPPPGADSLDAGRGADASLPLRERLELHRSDPSCAACHARMDPLGFGLEEFDAIGRSRAGEVGPADAHGELPDGRAFRGAVELAEMLAADGSLARQLAAECSVFALGRPLGRGEREHVQEVLDALAPGEPTLRGIVRGIALSRAFRTRSE